MRFDKKKLLFIILSSTSTSNIFNEKYNSLRVILIYHNYIIMITWEGNIMINELFCLDWIFIICVILKVKVSEL